MGKFRKKTVVIEARVFVDEGYNSPLAEWCGGLLGVDKAGLYLRINTLEGPHIARPGDWIVKGIKGEFYPCKPDIFAATYEAVDQ